MHGHGGRRAGGFVYFAALLVAAGVGAAATMSIVVWHTVAQRDREQELLFIGDEFRRAIESFHAATPGGVRGYPRDLSDLLHDPRFPGMKRHLRRIYADPMTGQPAWGLIRAPDGGIMGIHSYSGQTPLRRAGFPARYRAFAAGEHYSDWRFVHYSS